MKDLAFDETTIKNLMADEIFLNTYLLSIENVDEDLRENALAHVTEALRRKGLAIQNSAKHRREFAVPSDWMGDRISLRDYFAGQALSGTIAKGTTETISRVCRTIYEIADEMIQAREKKQ